MSGNVWEWVEDWYDEQFYSTGKAKEPNPVNTTEGKEGRRVVRGGGWDFTAEDSRVANRFRLTPALRYTDLGVRCARSAQGF